MPYVSDRSTGRIYWIEEVKYVPEGAHVEIVEPRPRPVQQPPAQPPGPSEFEIRLKQWEQQQIDARENTLRNQAWAAESQRRATALQTPKPQSKPTVYVPKVIDPSVR